MATLETYQALLEADFRKNDDEIARKSDIDNLSTEVRILVSNMKTMQWLVGTVVIAIIVSIFLQQLS